VIFGNRITGHLLRRVIARGGKSIGPCRDGFGLGFLGLRVRLSSRRICGRAGIDPIRERLKPPLSAGVESQALALLRQLPELADGFVIAGHDLSFTRRREGATGKQRLA
jgi:hypothetical protein